MLHPRRQLRLAQEAVMGVPALGDLGADDLDHPRRTQEDMLDLVDLAHPARPEALDDAVLAVDRLLEVAAEEVGDRLAAMGAGFEGTVDLGVTSDTAEGHFGNHDTASGSGC